MREELQKRCKLFINNRDMMKAGFAWESPYLYPLCASLYAKKDQVVDIEAMKIAKKMLKEETGVFSSFRGAAKMAIVAMVAMAPDQKQKLNEILQVHEQLKEVFRGSEYLPVAAAAITEFSGLVDYNEIVMRTRKVYDEMKSNHPFLTTREDAPFAALLALSSYDADYMGQEMERLYTILKEHFFKSNAVQSLSHVLVLGEGTALSKSQRVLDLYQTLKSKGYRYGTGYELATLGVLSMLDTDMKTLAGEIMEVDDYLRSQRGFGVFGVGAKQRLMYAGMLVMSDYVSAIGCYETAALNSIVSIIIAQQAAICASVAASSAAAASSASN